MEMALLALAGAPLAAEAGGACLWRPMVRNAHFHLPCQSWIKRFEESQSLFGSGSMMRFSCSQVVLRV